jgi:hypothetical protein
MVDAPLNAACNDEPHCRSTVVAHTVSGQPATRNGAASDVQSLLAHLCDTSHLDVLDVARIEVDAPDQAVQDLAASSSARMSESEPFRRPIGERTASTT